VRPASRLLRSVVGLVLIVASTALLAAPAGADQTGPPDAAGNYAYCDVQTATYGTALSGSGATSWTMTASFACNYGLLNGVTDLSQGASGAVFAMDWAYTPSGGSPTTFGQNMPYTTSPSVNSACDKVGSGNHQIHCWSIIQSGDAGIEATVRPLDVSFVYAQGSGVVTRKAALYVGGNTSHLGTNYNTTTGAQADAVPAYPSEHWTYGDYSVGITTTSGSQSTAGATITDVSANFDTSNTVNGHAGQLSITWTGTCQTITIDKGDGSTLATYSPSTGSPITVAVTYSVTGGPYTSTVACKVGSTTASSWTFSVTVVASATGLSTCFTSGFGLLNPVNFVKGIGCSLTVLFEPSSTTTSQISGIGSTLTTKAPFSIVVSAATFLPDAANAFYDGITARTVLGDRYYCAGVLGGGGSLGNTNPLSNSHIPGTSSFSTNDCDTSTLGSTSAGSPIALLRDLILAVVMIGLAIGIWRTTVRMIG
jgi:hypothetical protein